MAPAERARRLLLMYAVSNLGTALAPTYGVAVAARLLGGAAHAVFFAAVFAAAVSLVPAARAGRAVAAVGAGTSLALTIGVPGATAAGTALGWRWAFGGGAAFMAVMAVSVLQVLPRVRRTGRAPNDRVWPVVRRPSVLVVAAGVVVLTLGHYTPYTYISPILLWLGSTLDHVGPVLFGFGAAGILGLVLAGAMVDRHPVAALRAAGALLAIGLIALTLSGSAHPVGWVALLLWGTGSGALPTLIQAVALRAAPQSPDATAAVVNTTFNLGIAGGALLGGRELRLAAPSLLTGTGAALAVLALVVMTAFGRRSRPVDPPGTADP